MWLMSRFLFRELRKFAAPRACFNPPSVTKIFHTSPDWRRKNMKTLTTTMDPEKDPNSHEEFKEVVQSVCAQYLGGPWKKATTKDFAIERIR